MNHFVRTVATLAASVTAALAFGHGHPIQVGVENDRLTVSGGVADSAGYASQMYVEQDSAGDPQDFANFSEFGPAVYWIVPGFEIYGLEENCGLYLDALARPVKDSDPVEQRVLWYWNPSSSEVEIAPATTQMQIRRNPSDNILLTPTTLIAPPPTTVAAPLAGDMNFHNHDLIWYLLSTPLPPEGAYAFFARLTSDVYAPSDPFLVVINNGGVDGSQMITAALAINAAAVDLLPGNFNQDGTVDAADYTVWRNGLGTAYAPEDYNVWKDHFGQTAGGAGAATASRSVVPEPSSLALSIVAVLALLVELRSKTRRSPVSSSRTAAYHFSRGHRFRRDLLPRRKCSPEERKTTGNCRSGRAIAA